jgi:hypothetical protein
VSETALPNTSLWGDFRSVPFRLPLNAPLREKALAREEEARANEGRAALERWR